MRFGDCVLVLATSEKDVEIDLKLADVIRTQMEMEKTKYKVLRNPVLNFSVAVNNSISIWRFIMPLCLLLTR
jgi:hypothetical protein